MTKGGPSELAATWEVGVRQLITHFVFISLLSCSAVADEMKVLPLSPPSALLVDAAGDRQAATVEKFGQVSILEVALASKIAASDSTIAAVQQHAKYFDFFLVPIKFGVLGFDGKTCKWMQFGATLKSPGTDAGQVFILNIFPATSLKKGTWNAEGKATVSSDLKVETPASSPAKGSLSVGGSGTLAWTWSPLYQQVAAVFDQSRVIWRFDAVAPEFPVGEVEVGAIIAVAQSVAKNPRTRLGFDTEMRASFGGGWFDQAGVARADATVVVKLP
jgi:hypothetical protein